MSDDPIPRDYASWKHCITVHCGIPLTTNFVRRRLAVWRDSDSEETRRFRSLYGEQHLQRVVQWLEQAELELGGGDTHQGSAD